jgi:PKD repeat protein/subtilisin family serine protease
MKGFPTFWICILMGLSNLFAQPQINIQHLDAHLLTLTEEHPEDYHQVYLLLKDRVDIVQLEQNLNLERAKPEARSMAVITQLKQKAASTQGAVIAKLQRLAGVETSTIHPLWITNVIFVSMRAEAIAKFSHDPRIAWIGWNAPIELESYRDEPYSPYFPTPGGIEPGLAAINAPAIWKLGYTGYGRSVLSIDTGVDHTHPALSHRYRGLFVPGPQAWYDYQTGTTAPFVCGNGSNLNDHGTHTVGTVVGLDPNTQDTIGVAFGGMWMGAPAICDALSEDNIATFQWALDPDQNPGTASDMPDVINNSWRAVDLANECNNQLHLEAFTALEAAGIAVVFSAGNSGPGSSTITAPKNISVNEVNTFSVAAVNGNVSNFPIAGFSSRGPSICSSDTGSLKIKPEVSAPGQVVRSCELNGSYGVKSGTSMAAPHVSGAIMLLKEAFPFLTGQEIKWALYNTCTDLGNPGEDNVYGMGMIDVLAAYNYLLAQGNTPVTPNLNDDAAITSLFNIPAILCDSFVSPQIVLANKGESNLQSATINYEFDNGTFGGFTWNGNLAKDSSVTLSLPTFPMTAGTYRLTVEATNPNGVADYRNLDNRRESLFVVPGAAPMVSSDTVCQGASALITANHQTGSADVWWYADSSADEPLYTGNPLLIPALDSSLTLYAGTGWIGNIGEANNTGGVGDYGTGTGEGLIFDVWYPFTLKSVQVYSQSDGYRTIELKDQNGNLIDQEIAFINIGEVRVELDFYIPPGENYTLSLQTTAGLYSHVSGASYPYEVPGIVSIQRSTKGFGPYFYFYNWEVEYENICGRTRVEVVADTGLMQAAFSISNHQLSIPDSATVSFTDLSTNAQSWFWDFGDGTTSTQQNPVHTYTQPGVFVVSLSAVGPDGCANATTDTLEVTEEVISTNVSGIFLSSIINIYPNPSSGVFHVIIPRERRLFLEMGIYDMKGSRIDTNIDFKNSSENITLDLSSYPKGIYYLHIATENDLFVNKLIKTN